jgi:hypothetical protein
MKRLLQKPSDADLRRALRVTGNAAFVAFAIPLAAPERLAPTTTRTMWRAFVAIHLVHASFIARLALRHRYTNPFSAVSIVGGAVGYTTIAALTAGRLQRAGQNVLLGLHAFTIVHGYAAKGRNALAYGPLAALWLAAAAGMNRTWSR